MANYFLKEKNNFQKTQGRKRKFMTSNKRFLQRKL